MPVNESSLHVVTRSVIRQLLTWEAVLEATEAALTFIPHSSSTDTSSTQVTYPNGSLHLKAAALQPASVLSVKSNLRPSRGRASGAILAYDLEAEKLVAITDLAYLTGMRTAAIALVALRHLCDHEQPTVALVGLGPVSRLTIDGLRHNYPHAPLRAWSRSAASRDDLEPFRREQLELLSDDLNTVLQGADVVITAAPAREPFLFRRDLSRATLVLAMGADTVGKRELADDFVDQVNVIVDVAADAVRVGESAYLNKAPIELGAIINKTVARPTKYDLTVFDSVGSALGDAAVVHIVLQQLGTDDAVTLDLTQ